MNRFFRDVTGVLLCLQGLLLCGCTGNSSEDRNAADRREPATATDSSDASTSAHAQEASNAEPTAAPIIQLEPASLHLGEAGVEVEVGGTVQLVNIGETPARIVECRKSCKCAALDCPAGTVLAPGESIELEIMLKTPRTSGRIFRQFVTFIIEDHAPLRLPVSADVVAYVEVDPSPLDPSRHVDGRVVLRSRHAQPFRILSMTPPLITEFDDEPRTEHVLHIDWQQWRAGHRLPLFTFMVDHPKTSAAHVQVLTVRTATDSNRAGDADEDPKTDDDTGDGK